MKALFMISMILGAFGIPPRLSAQQGEATVPPPAAEASVADVSRRLAGVEARIRMSSGSQTELHLERLRLLYFLSVADEDFIPPALHQIDMLEEGGAGAPDLPGVLEAFGAAIEVVRGKHAFWPMSKVSHVRDGLKVLDALLARSPDLAEARYLRLLSCYYLPFFFGRGDTVTEDLEALSDLLLVRPPLMSWDAYDAVVDFVITRGELGGQRRSALAAAQEMARPGGGEVP